MNNHTNLHTSIDNDAIPIKIDAVITGAGFAGMYMLYKLRNLGLSACIIEAGKNVGGTWYWNRYPGARCDVWSMEYSYQFSEELQQEWEWTEKYATQPEILSYANHVADRFDLRKDIYFGNRVHSAIFNDDSNNWSIKTDSGLEFLATFCIMATGCLSSVNQPHFQGIDKFVTQWMAAFVAALFKFFKQFLLPMGQVIWRFDYNSRMEVSTSVVSQLGHAFVAETKNLVRLGACRDF